MGLSFASSCWTFSTDGLPRICRALFRLLQIPGTVVSLPAGRRAWRERVCSLAKLLLIRVMLALASWLMGVLCKIVEASDSLSSCVQIIGGRSVTPRVHSGLTYTRARGPVVPFQGGWFPNTRGLRPCLSLRRKYRAPPPQRGTGGRRISKVTQAPGSQGPRWHSGR